jgi:tetratricopeptide (TPR) repeat protein
VCWSPDGALIAAAAARDLNSRQSDVRVWDARDGRLLTAFRGQGCPVKAVCFSPDGGRVASGGIDGSIKVWEARTGEETQALVGHAASVYGICWSADGSRIASAAGGIDRDRAGEVKVWDAHTGQETLALRGHLGDVTSVCFTSDGRCLASTAKDGTVKIWDGRPPVKTAPAEAAALERERALFWHQTQARDGADAGRWFAAAFHLRQLAEIDPGRAAFHARLARVHLEQGERVAATAELERALRLEAGDPEALIVQALLCAERGDVAGHRRACAALLPTARARHDARLSEDALAAWVLGPGEAGLFLTLVGHLPPTPYERTSRQHTLFAAAHIRSQSPARTPQWLKASRDRRPEDAPVHEELWLALALHQLGQVEEARRWLEQAERWLGPLPGQPAWPTALVGAGAAGPTGLLAVLGDPPPDPLRQRLGWLPTLELRLLQREAEDRLRTPKP